MAIHKVLASRLSKAGIEQGANALTAQEYEELFAFVRDTIASIPSELAALESLEELGIRQVSNWILKLPVELEGDVTALWPFFHSGIRMKFSALAENIPELWYPGGDDLLVTDQDRSWVLKLDHEEQVLFYRR